MTPKSILQRCQRLIKKHVDQSNTSLLEQLRLFNQLSYNYLSLSDRKYAYLKASLLRTLVDCLYLVYVAFDDPDTYVEHLKQNDYDKSKYNRWYINSVDQKVMQKFNASIKKLNKELKEKISPVETKKKKGRLNDFLSFDALDAFSELSSFVHAVPQDLLSQNSDCYNLYYLDLIWALLSILEKCFDVANAWTTSTEKIEALFDCVNNYTGITQKKNREISR